MALGLEASLREIFATDRMVREEDVVVEVEEERGVSSRWATPTPALDTYDEKYLSSYRVSPPRTHSRAFSDVSMLDAEFHNTMPMPRPNRSVLISRPNSQALSVLSTGTIVGPRADNASTLDTTPTPSPREGNTVEWGYAI